MERFSQREDVLMGCSSPKTPFKNRDIDFHDVFGGPPRRSSMQEMRYSLTETVNSSTTQGEEDPVLPLSPWSGGGLNDMPVFGEEAVNRRRYPSDDFFDDIFRGEESVLSSPRRSNHDPFGSNPGSRVMSPARPLAPRADPFGSSQFQFSLPAKLTKAIDFPLSASSSRSPYKYKEPASNVTGTLYTPSPPLSRLSSGAFQEEDELRNEIRPSHRPSPLSHESSLSSKDSSNEKKYGELESADVGGNLKRELKTTQAPINVGLFHFSIYKWASKGVPLLMPLRGDKSVKSKERVKTERCSSSNGRIESDNMANGLQTTNWHASDLHFLHQSVSASDESSYTEIRKQVRGSFTKTSAEDGVEASPILEEAVLSMPETRSVENELGDAIMNEKRKEIKPHTLSETGLCKSTENQTVMSKQKDEKPELKPLRSLFSDADEEQGKDDKSKKFEGKDKVKHSTLSDSNGDSKDVKKRDERGNKSNRSESIQVNEPHPQKSRKMSGDTLGRNGAKGKVKEFVKIFNQEAASEPKTDSEIRSLSSRWKRTAIFGTDNEPSANTTQATVSRATFETENEGSAYTTQATRNNHARSVNKIETPPNASVMVDKNLESEKQKTTLKTTVFDASESSSCQKDASALSSESFPHCAEVTDGNIDDDIFQETFMIKELSNDQDKPLQTRDGFEDIKISDAKIRQWSDGKEGNIRSLLSTLQYVLWPGCGWKPVPLMDIIEGSAVKRAYQKALLCLHPDKLQQKCAASHQKYIAEKVFDILQEAWDHFNSLGAT